LQKIKIAITGSSGYVGGRVIDYFSSLGFLIVRIPSQAELLKSSITDSAPLDSSYLQKLISGCTHLIHLAAMNAADAISNPIEAEAVNVGYTNLLLNACVKSGVTCFIFMSTIHVYSGKLEGYYDEFSSVAPKHPYALTKKKAEDSILNMVEYKNIKRFIFRLSNVVGSPSPLYKRASLLAGYDFCNQLIHSREIKLKGAGSDMRDYICMSDILGALKIFVVNSEKICEGIYNLSSGASMKTRALADLAASVFEKNYNIKCPVIDIIEFSESLELLIANKKIKKTGFVINGNIEDELLETMKHILENQNAC
jgi:UDP-glucose 4-epimerase